jgi:hypothetical protein
MGKWMQNNAGKWVVQGGANARPGSLHMGVAAKSGGMNAQGSAQRWNKWDNANHTSGYSGGSGSTTGASEGTGVDASYSDAQYFEQLAPLHAEFNRTKLDYLQRLAKMRHDNKSAKYDLNTKYAIERDRSNMDFADRGLVTGGNSGNVNQIKKLMLGDYKHSLSDINHTYGSFAQHNIQAMIDELERGVKAQQAALLGSAKDRYLFLHDKTAPEDIPQNIPTPPEVQAINPFNAGPAAKSAGGWQKNGSTWVFTGSNGAKVRMPYGPGGM